MKYYRLVDSFGNLSLVVETGENQLEDITSVEEDLDDLAILLRAASYSGTPVDDLARDILLSLIHI